MGEIIYVIHVGLIPSNHQTLMWGLHYKISFFPYDMNPNPNYPHTLPTRYHAAILFRELAQGEYEASRQVKFRMLMLWLPLFSYASNGLTFPILTEYERAEMERVMEELIMSLPPADQEVILNNWLQDYAVSSSDWPNLHRCYEKWCRSSRNLLF